MDESNFKILLKNCRLRKRIKQVAKELDKRYLNESLVLICVLKGAIKFYGELLGQLKNKDLEMDFIQVKSYKGTESTGEIKLLKDISTNIKGKNVVLVEDILDTGLTAKFLQEHLNGLGPKSLLMCTLIQKTEKLSVKLEMPVLAGFEIENRFVIGFGLDLDEKYRNLKDILVLNNG